MKKIKLIFAEVLLLYELGLKLYVIVSTTHAMVTKAIKYSMHGNTLVVKSSMHGNTVVVKQMGYPIDFCCNNM